MLGRGALSRRPRNACRKMRAMMRASSIFLDDMAACCFTSNILATRLAARPIMSRSGYFIKTHTARANYFHTRSKNEAAESAFDARLLYDQKSWLMPINAPYASLRYGTTSIRRCMISAMRIISRICPPARDTASFLLGAGGGYCGDCFKHEGHRRLSISPMMPVINMLLPPL